MLTQPPSDSTPQLLFTAQQRGQRLPPVLQDAPPSGSGERQARPHAAQGKFACHSGAWHSAEGPGGTAAPPALPRLCCATFRMNAACPAGLSSSALLAASWLPAAIHHTPCSQLLCPRTPPAASMHTRLPPYLFLRTPLLAAGGHPPSASGGPALRRPRRPGGAGWAGRHCGGAQELPPLSDGV